MGRGLYIHIPFCKKKCNYCDFVSFTTIEMIDEYLDLLSREIELFKELYKYNDIKTDGEFMPQIDDIDTIFIGGGTPSILSSKQLEKLFSILRNNFNIDDVVEFTVECNPGTVDLEKLNVMFNNGVNRLSFGLQAKQSEHLTLMGRIHTSEEFENSYRLARKVGFNNINVDVIFAFHGQTKDDLVDTLDFVFDLGPEHISLYSLIIEENTRFNTYLEKGIIDEFDESEFIEMYRLSVDRMKKNGYRQYEISNYYRESIDFFDKKVNEKNISNVMKNKTSENETNQNNSNENEISENKTSENENIKKKILTDKIFDYSCKHNIKYWKQEEYFGFGISSSGYLNSRRYTNVSSYREYKASIDNGRLPIEFEEKISYIDSYNESLMLGLRMNDGVNMTIFESINDLENRDRILCTLEKLVDDGYASVEEGRLKLSQFGREIANSIIVSLMM
ncbi:radical SAM family heme chaperone HemW [Peptostreptococcus porci]|uniref:radical SAM family heme chaperone HemW n=1 Tax=Peptostreptococcus porci TaxID=2652282 RepID=UPI002A90D635|nr:radical SAM family heme chaperone HemW [Peptostreptococcus porci]MDY5435966.1 radical SAM family heme chaperone HemW [Peptostreptococcus porci]